MMPNHMIERMIYENVITTMMQFPVITITGPRQVGKTTLVKKLAEALPTLQIENCREAIYLDLESPSDLLKLDDAETYLNSHQDKCIIIDEVQQRPDLFPLIRSLVDRNRRPSRFILLGSASPTLINRSSESLAGRICYTELTPFSLNEILVGLDKKELNEDKIQNKHWLLGGFPEVFLSSNIDQAYVWLQNFISTYVQRDLLAFGANISAPLLLRMLRMFSTLQGQLLEFSSLSNSLAITVQSLKNYLDLLEHSYLITRLEPFTDNIKKRLVKSPKLYVRDSGILHYLLDIQSIEKLRGNAIIGASWEGYAIEQIRRVAMVHDRRARFYFYRTHGGAECDLVIELPSFNKRYCVEIKVSNSARVSKGFHEAVVAIQPDQSFLVFPKGESYTTKHGINYCDLKTFLNTFVPSLFPYQTIAFEDSNPKITISLEARFVWNLNKLWKQWGNYIDNEISFQRDLRSTPEKFNQRHFEMSLGCTLLNRGYEIKNCKERGFTKKNSEGPDFEATLPSGTPLWIEAICPSRGTESENYPAPFVFVESKDIHRSIGETPDHNNIQLRYAQAIKEKSNKFLHYLQRDMVTPFQPLIIAISSANLQEDVIYEDTNLIPSIVEYCFGVNGKSITFDFNLDHTEQELKQHKTTKKAQNGPITLTSPFTEESKDEYNHISAIIFSNQLGIREHSLVSNVSTKFIAILNPYARNLIQPGMLLMDREYAISKDRKQLNIHHYHHEIDQT